MLEFKWGERTWHDRENAARDSGLLVHSNGSDGGYNGIWMPSIEVQIIEGGVGDFVPVPGPDEDGKPCPSLTRATLAAIATAKSYGRKMARAKRFERRQHEARQLVRPRPGLERRKRHSAARRIRTARTASGRGST